MGSSLFLLRSGLSATGGFTDDEDDVEEEEDGMTAEGVFAGFEVASMADVSSSIWRMKNLGCCTVAIFACKYHTNR